jgi:hypothetical protein
MNAKEPSGGWRVTSAGVPAGGQRLAAGLAAGSSAGAVVGNEVRAGAGLAGFVVVGNETDALLLRRGRQHEPAQGIEHDLKVLVVRGNPGLEFSQFGWKPVTLLFGEIQ